MSARTVDLPTEADDLRLMLRTVRLVLSAPLYALLGAGGAAVGLSLFVLAQNTDLLFDVIVGGDLPLDARLTVLVNLYPYLGTAFEPMTEALLVVTALLFGVNVALLGYHLAREGVSLKSGTGSATGMVLGTLGAGCVACGTAVLSGVFALFGAAGVLTLLPLDGNEFTVLALLSLVVSIYWLADGMRGGEVDGCPVETAD